MSKDQIMDTNDEADALYDAIHTRIFRKEFRETYARLVAASSLDLVRAAFERGAAWQSRRAEPEITNEMVARGSHALLDRTMDLADRAPSQQVWKDAKADVRAVLEAALTRPEEQ